MAVHSIADEIMDFALSGTRAQATAIKSGAQAEREHGENTVKLRALCAAIRNIAIIFLIFMLVSCSSPKAKYSEGQEVIIKITKQTGMIVDISCSINDNYCYYVVRLFTTPQMYTDTKLFSSDGPIYTKGSYIRIMFAEFEIEGLRDN